MQLPVQLLLALAAVAHLAWAGGIAAIYSAAVAIDGLGSGRIARFAKPVAALAHLGLLSAAALELTGIAVLLLARVRYPAMSQSGGFWAAMLLPLVLGLAALGLFRSLLDGDRAPSLRPLVGLAGIGLLVTSCYVLVAGAGALLKPEQWQTSEPFYRFLPTWSGSGRFLEFTLASFAAAGALVAWAGRREEEGVARFARRLGGGTTLVCAVAWPLATLFIHFNLPDVSLSAPLWGVAAAVLLVSGATAALAAARMGPDGAAVERLLAIAVAALFALLVVSDHLSRERVLRPEVLAGVVAVPEAAARPAAPAEESGKLAAGKAVYDRLCHLCHRFDVKLVGPPFNQTVPKYRKDPEALRAFIRNPVKKDPAYPAMPKPAVTDAEIDAVAAWLLERASP